LRAAWGVWHYVKNGNIGRKAIVEAELILPNLESAFGPRNVFSEENSTFKRVFGEEDVAYKCTIGANNDTKDIFLDAIDIQAHTANYAVQFNKAVGEEFLHTCYEDRIRRVEEESRGPQLRNFRFLESSTPKV
jgi:hypothetical protein